MPNTEALVPGSATVSYSPSAPPPTGVDGTIDQIDNSSFDEFVSALCIAFGNIDGAFSLIQEAAKKHYGNMALFVKELHRSASDKSNEEKNHAVRQLIHKRWKGIRSVVCKILEARAETKKLTEGMDDRSSHAKNLLGRGEFGAVFDVDTYPELNAVAKVNRPRRGATDMSDWRFRREKAAQKFLTEHGCDIGPAFLAEGTLMNGEEFLLMEKVKGQDLDGYLHDMRQSMVDEGTLKLTDDGKLPHEGARLPLEDASAQFVELIRGLQHAHNVGVVHRDIKPANIIGNRIMDWGMAGLSHRNDDMPPEATMNVDKTTMLDKLGSPLYMSPSQWKSAMKKQPQNDMYSLGLTYMEAVTGKKPRSFRTMDEVAVWFEEFEQGKRQEDFSSLEKFPPEVEQAVRALMAGDGDTAASLLEAVSQGKAGSLKAKLKQTWSRIPHKKKIGGGVALAVLLAAMSPLLLAPNTVENKKSEEDPAAQKTGHSCESRKNLRNE
jgi:serine/threonine protein kinase